MNKKAEKLIHEFKIAASIFRKMAMEREVISWNDGRLSGGRYPLLWLIKEGRIHKFEGKSIPGVCVVLTEGYEKSGKWSNTDYQIELSPGVKHINIVGSLHGRSWPQPTLIDGLDWLQEQIGGVDMDSFIEAIKQDFPKTYQRWQETEKALMEMGEEASDIQRITLTRGPNKRPYWGRPIFYHSEYDPVGVDMLIEKIKVGLQIPLIEGLSAKITDIKHTPGFRGGSYTVTAAVPAGWEMRTWVPEENE